VRSLLVNVYRNSFGLFGVTVMMYAHKFLGFDNDQQVAFSFFCPSLRFKACMAASYVLLQQNIRFAFFAIGVRQYAKKNFRDYALRRR
jgi:hypothetical protein